jgi:hypothetical protein
MDDGEQKFAGKTITQLQFVPLKTLSLSRDIPLRKTIP